MVVKPMGLDAKALVRVLHAAHLHDVSRQDLLQLACERIRAAGAPYTSVYAYMLAGDELVLEAHAGRDTEHVRIPWARVCVEPRWRQAKTRTSPTGPRSGIISPSIST